MAAPGQDAKPKRAASAYFLFGNSIRSELIEESKKNNGGKAKVAEVAKTIGERWAKLPAEEKAKFEEQAKEAKEKHAAEMHAYNEANDPLAALKEKYADLIPKKAAGAYWIFAQDDSQRAIAEKALKDAGEEATYKKITTKLGELWKSSGDAEKVVWNEKAKQAAAEYEEKRKVWEATPEFVEYQRVENEHKEAQKEKKAKEKAAAKEEEAKAKAAAKEDSTPSKRKATKGDENSSTSAKKTKNDHPKKVAKKEKDEVPLLTDDVLKKAQSLGLEAALRNLVSRSDVMAKEFTHEKLLDALQESGGLVNKARYTLLGA